MKTQIPDYAKTNPLQMEIIRVITDSLTPFTLFSEVIINVKDITEDYNKDRKSNLDIDNVYWTVEGLEDLGFLTIRKLFFGTQRIAVAFTTAGILAINNQSNEKITEQLDAITN